MFSLLNFPNPQPTGPPLCAVLLFFQSFVIYSVSLPLDFRNSRMLIQSLNVGGPHAESVLGRPADTLTCVCRLPFLLQPPPLIFFKCVVVIFCNFSSRLVVPWTPPTSFREDLVVDLTRRLIFCSLLPPFTVTPPWPSSTPEVTHVPYAGWALELINGFLCP